MSSISSATGAGPGIRELTTQEIERLASRPGVRRIAVENFLMSMHGLRASEAYMNLMMDARSYGWNGATVAAINAGIRQAETRQEGSE